MTNYIVDYLDKFGAMKTNFVQAYSVVEARKKAYEMFDTITIVNVTEAYETH